MSAAARVLVVDDNASFVDNLVEILGDSGYSTLTAGSCAGAKEAAAKGFDIALVDMRLPDGTGTALVGDLKSLSPEAAIILLTGYSTVEAAAAAVRAGAFAYLAKPCATPELLLTLEQARRHVQLHLEKRDLARRVQTSEKLAAVGTMTAGLSHEIRNPLNAAGIQLSVLERRIEKIESAELKAALLQPLTLVRDEVRRLDQLLEDFLQLARPRKIEPRPVDLAELVARVLDLLAGDAERRGAQIVRRLGDRALVLGDDGQLRQVVMNLTLNALEASERGSVTLQLSHDGPEVVLSVDDTGPGIPQELRERIFEPFFTTKAQGTGLGLPIVHAIVIQHGGSLTVGEAPSGGARFALRLPRAP